jgi:hypothetical protein
MSPNLHPGPFVDYLELVPIYFICREQGCRSNDFQSLVDILVATLLESDGFGEGVWQSDSPSYREHILQAQSRRFSPPRHERVITRQANFGDSPCMRTGSRERSGEGANNSPQEHRGCRSLFLWLREGRWIADVEVKWRVK